MSEFEWIGTSGALVRTVCRPQLEWIQELLREGEYLLAATYQDDQDEEHHSYLHLLSDERLFSAINLHPGNAVSCWELAEITDVEVTGKHFHLSGEVTITARDTAWAGPELTILFLGKHSEAERFADAVRQARADGFGGPALDSQGAS